MKKLFSADIEEEIVMRFRKFCEDNGYKKNFIVGKALNEFLDRNEKGNENGNELNLKGDTLNEIRTK